ncbi:MAG: hypothetical protein GTN40_01750 [Candidatus Aenigmarchaeota archaeon]|nr:hypothetical protein [Candidatus Aenigmarchaeota archaeon]
MKIGVYGSSGGDLTQNKIKKKAREIGREIARKGHILITGACPGLPYDAVLGAAELDGKVIGFSPATDLKTHIKRDKFPTKGFTEIIFIPKSYKYANNSSVCRKFRNVSSVAEIDAVVIIGGRTGTMNEFTIAYDFGKNIGVLERSGGITDRTIKTLLKDIDKKGAKIIFDPNPVSLIDKLIKLQK